MLDPDRYFALNVDCLPPPTMARTSFRRLLGLTIERLAGGCIVYRLTSVTVVRPKNETRIRALRERLP